MHGLKALFPNMTVNFQRCALGIENFLYSFGCGMVVCVDHIVKDYISDILVPYVTKIISIPHCLVHFFSIVDRKVLYWNALATGKGIFELFHKRLGYTPVGLSATVVLVVCITAFVPKVLVNNGIELSFVDVVELLFAALTLPWVKVEIIFVFVKCLFHKFFYQK